MACVTLADITAKHNLGVEIPRTERFILQEGPYFSKLTKKAIKMAKP